VSTRVSGQGPTVAGLDSFRGINDPEGALTLPDHDGAQRFHESRFGLLRYDPAAISRIYAGHPGGCSGGLGRPCCRSVCFLLVWVSIASRALANKEACPCRRAMH